MPTQVPTEIVHIEWFGPFTIDEACELRGPTDYGIYQIYGGHPVYGSDVLLYIGMTCVQYFGTRINQHRWWVDYNHDASRIRVYVGRLHGEATPSDDVWTSQIKRAERLLVFACQPAFNTQKNLGKLDADLQNLHVLNWGRIRDLLPEVSGSRWSSKYDVVDPYVTFDETEIGKTEQAQV